MQKEHRTPGSESQRDDGAYQVHARACIERPGPQAAPAPVLMGWGRAASAKGRKNVPDAQPMRESKVNHR